MGSATIVAMTHNCHVNIISHTLGANYLIIILCTVCSRSILVREPGFVFLIAVSNIDINEIILVHL